MKEARKVSDVAIIRLFGAENCTADEDASASSCNMEIMEGQELSPGRGSLSMWDGTQNGSPWHTGDA